MEVRGLMRAGNLMEFELNVRVSDKTIIPGTEGIKKGG
jgi:hypothetical protein